MNNLLKLRKDIDRCDRELVNVLSVRFSLIKKIALYKKENNLKILDKARWQEVVNNVLAIAKKKKLSEKFVRSIIDSIGQESLKIEIKENEK